MDESRESSRTDINPKYCWSLLAKLTIIPIVMIVWMFGVYVISLSHCNVPYNDQISFALKDVIGICIIIGTTIFALINFCKPFINFLQFLFEDDECEDNNTSFKKQISLLSRVQLSITSFMIAVCFFIPSSIQINLILQWVVACVISSVVHILTLNLRGRQEFTQFFIFIVVTLISTCFIQPFNLSREIFLIIGFSFWVIVYKILFSIIRTETKGYSRLLKKKMHRYMMLMLFNLILIMNVFILNYDSSDFIFLKQTPVIDYCKCIFQSEVPKKIFSWIVSCI